MATKKDIARRVADRLRTTDLEGKEIVDLVLSELHDAVTTEGRLELRNFGVFEVCDRAARKARNPRTNEEVHVPPRRVVVFRSGERLADDVNGNDDASDPG